MRNLLTAKEVEDYKNDGAIASKLSAKIYKLDIVANNIENEKFRKLI